MMSDNPSQLIASVDNYLHQLASALDAGLDGNLVALWLAGSLTTSDFSPERSDIDVIVISRERVADDAKTRVTSLLRHDILPVPAHGLDLVMYREAEVRSVKRVPESEYAIASGQEWSDEVSRGGSYPGAILDLGFARQRGAALEGPEPRELIGPIPEPWIVDELAATVRWHATHVHDPFHDATGSNAVLNACRALHYVSERAFVSKSRGAEWLLARGAPEIVGQAFAGRAAASREPLDRRDVLLFLEEASKRLELASLHARKQPEGASQEADARPDS